MKVMKFRDFLAEKIIKGTKTTTWRIKDDKNLSQGEIVEFQNWNTGEKFGEAELVEIKEKTLGEAFGSEKEGHEAFKNEEEMINTYKVYYGEDVNLDTPVKIIKFSFIKS